jgi:hypothetical protein
MKYIAIALLCIATLAACKKDNPEYVVVNGTLYLDSIETVNNASCTVVRGEDVPTSGFDSEADFNTGSDGNFTFKMKKGPSGPVLIIMAFHNRKAKFTLPGDVSNYSAGNLYVQ